MKKVLRILIVEDSEDDALLILHQIEKGGYDIEFNRIETDEKMRASLKEKKWDIILSDYKMPLFNGLEALAIIKESGIDIPFIIVSGMIGEDVAVEAMKAGAHDYIMKNNLLRLLPAVERELRESARRVEKRLLEQKQKLAEELLKLSEERYRIVADFTYDWEYWRSSDGSVLYISPSCKRITGYSPEEFKATPELLSTIIHPDDRQVIYEHLRIPMDSKKIFEHEFRIISRDRQEYWIEHICQPVYSADGHFLGRRASNRDITVRKLAEEALCDSEQRYRLLIETVNEGILVAHNGFLKFVNPMMQVITGFTQEELFALPFIEYVHPDDREIVISNQLKRLKGEQFSTRYQFRIVKKDGSTRSIEINGIIIEWEGQPATLNVLTDITERKKAEAEIKLINEQLLKLNAEKDKFFSIIAHDLKSPFNSIVGFSDLLAEHVKEKDFDGIEKYSQIIGQSSKRAMDLLMNLMEWSQSQTGRMNFNPEYFEISDLVNEIALLFTDIAGQKSINITKELFHNAPVYADKAMISTVLRNLVSNAIKFTKPNGNIIISSIEKKNEVVISVQDTGVGVPKSAIEKLFRIDENYSTPGTQNEKGTGLGLVLCKEFIEKHGGEIWVKVKLAMVQHSISPCQINL